MTGQRVYVGATFDLLHPGHITLLRVARQVAGPAGRVWVALNRDEFIERYKGRRPVQSLEERFEVVSAIRYVDHVIVNYGDEDSKEAIVRAAPSVIVVGNDWAPLERYCQQMSFTEVWLRQHDVHVMFVTRTPNASSLLRAKSE